MIDTVVLNISESSMKIVEPSYFGTTANEIENWRFGPIKKWTQNPSKNRLRKGVYMPNLTLYKRARNVSWDITLNVQFSIPKLLYGNNYDEVQNNDFQKIIDRLHVELYNMGVIVSEESIARSEVSVIHYSKNIIMPKLTPPYFYIKEIYKANMNRALDLNWTDFRNGGYGVKYHANGFELAFYDKNKDFQRSKISDKRAEDSNALVQMDLFNDVKTPIPGTLRMELRLNNKQKIKGVLEKCQMGKSLVFKDIFSEEYSKKILTYYLELIRKNYPKVLLWNQSCPEKRICDLLTNKPKWSIGTILETIGATQIIEKVGVVELRNMIEGKNSKSWYRINHRLKQIETPTSTPFDYLVESIRNGRPTRLVDFKGQMINNDKYKGYERN